MKHLFLLGTALATASVPLAGAAAQTGSQPAPQADDTGQDGAVERPADPNAPAAPTVVVTGIRQSVADAIAIKRNAATVSDAISSEDIAKFPDQNLAESLQRIPGVQIDRNKGEGASVSVRGLGSNFTTTFYNGRVIPSPAAGRDFSFTSLGSDFVRSIRVTKTPTSDIIDGGLAAVINVEVTRPLDLGRNRTAITAEGIYEENPKKFTPHLSFYTNRVFADGDIGVNFGVDYKRRGVIQAGYNSWGLETKAESPSRPAFDYNLDGRLNGSYRIEHALALWSDEGMFDRLNLVGGVQVKPFYNVELHADALYSRFVDDYIRYEHQIRFTNIGTTAARIHASEVTSDGIVTYLDADGVDNRSGGRDTYVEDRTFSGAFGGKAEFGPLTLSAEGTYSRASRLNSFIQLSVITRARASYDIRNNWDTVPAVSFNRGYDPFDLSQYRLFGFNGELESPTRDSNRDFRFDAAYDLPGFLNKLNAGVYFARASKSFRNNRYSFTMRLASEVLGLPYSSAEGGTVDASSIVRIEDYSQYVGEEIGHYVAPSRDLLFKNVSLDDFLDRSPVFTDETQNYAVSEKVTAFYGRADFSSANGVLKGNVGLRYTRTILDSTGTAPDISQVVVPGEDGNPQDDEPVSVPAASPVSVHNDYQYWLPSLNLRWAPAERFVVRLGLGRVMTRPDLGLLSPRTTINANTRTISSQNPYLKPYLANQADLSLEYYIGRTGILSAAFFYKDVKNFVVPVTTFETHVVRRADGTTGPEEFARTRQENATGAKVKGVELAAQLPLSFLPGPLDGFGINANLTLLDTSDVKVTLTGPPVPVTGVSKRSYTVGGYYEKEGFGIRANYNYRSRYVVSQLANFGDGQFTEPYGQLDISTSYAINRNLSLRLDVSNVTHAIQKRTNNLGLLRNTYDYGRRISGAVRMRF